MEREDLVAPAAAPRQRRPVVEDEIEYDEGPIRGGRRYAGEDTSTRMRRSDLEDTSTRMRRAEMDDTRSFRPDFDEPSGRQRRYVPDEEEFVPRSRRRAAEPEYDDAPRGRRRAEAVEYDDMPRPRGGRYDDDQPSRRSARYEPRFGGEAEEAPRARRDRGADLDRADSGRHSRSGFVDFDDEGDETPTLVDMATRRAMRAGNQQEAVRGQAGRGARRGGRGRMSDDVADDEYWSQLRGEAN
jgi:hypothetical protein